MKTIILYATRHGAAKEAAELIQEMLGDTDIGLAEAAGR